MKNINLDAVRNTIEKTKSEPKTVQIPLDIQGSWNMDDAKSQFEGSIKLPNGESVIFESEFPPFLGGKGSKPSPLMFCFWGGMACFASTFALTAALENINIKNFSMRTTGLIDFHQGLGIGEEPPISNLKWEVTVESDESQEKLERLVQLAEERCPASWMLKNVVAFEVGLVRQ